MVVQLRQEHAESFAATALRNVVREYPNKLDHVMCCDEDLQSPRELHPVFYGCFDWHSCVHGYWLLATLIRFFPSMRHVPAIEQRFHEAFTAKNFEREVRYFNRPASRGFERPYGWAWLLLLTAELRLTDDSRSRCWHTAIAPLAELIATRFTEFLRQAIYPIRSGTHSNTAFALALAREYAVLHGDGALLNQIEQRVRDWYAEDAHCEAWEPSLDDFLSPSLMEVECVRRCWPRKEFEVWLSRFFPKLGDAEPAAIFVPARVVDRTDGKIAHLDGLNFSRAWCMAGVASALERGDARKQVLSKAAADHVAASLPYITADYAGEHWLATFALLALMAIDSADEVQAGATAL